MRAVLASSFERIHRANLVGMGIVPLTFAPGEGWRELGLDGTETLDVDGLASALAAGTKVRVRARRAGFDRLFEASVGTTTASEVRQLVDGGIFRSARSRFAPARERTRFAPNA